MLKIAGLIKLDSECNLNLVYKKSHLIMKKALTLFVLLITVVSGIYANDSLQVVQTIDLSSSIFKNVYAKSGPEKAEIKWALDYEALDQLKGKKIFVKYNTDIGAKRHKSGMEGSDYSFSPPLDLGTYSYELQGLKGNEKYVFYIGVSDTGADDNAVLSKKGKFKTDRSWGITRLLILFGSLAFFIFGMKVMSEGLQQAAGKRLRNMLASITSNRVKGVFTGFGITSIVQSSSVTTVMTVSFVNAGLMTLRQSAGVMMGANIGTTITAWLILLLGFKVSVASYAFIILAFAGPLLFTNNSTLKSWANALIGFCILFIGLSALKDSVPDLDPDSAFVQFFFDFKDVWYGPIMFVLLGAFVTIIIQSSSAAMALTLTLVAKGAIPFEVACAMVLGENIGTTITAELASLIANVHAKRSARIHSMFNIIGVTWMLILFTPFLKGLGYLVGWVEGDTFDAANTSMANTGIAFFHTLFNLANVLLLIWFVPQLVNIAVKTVKSRGDADEEFHLEYIASGMMSTPELSLLEAKKEVAKFGKIVRKQTTLVKELLTETSKKKNIKLMSKIKKYEEITDQMEVEISNYVTKVSKGKMTDLSSEQLRAILSIIKDLERIGDIGYQMSINIDRKIQKSIYFTPNQRENLTRMFEAVNKALVEMEENLNSDYDAVSKTKASDLERNINILRDKLVKEHLLNIEKEEYNIQSGLIYNDLFSSLEKIGDHSINVTEAILGEVT